MVNQSGCVTLSWLDNLSIGSNHTLNKIQKQDDKKAENEIQGCNFKIHKRNRNDEEHEQQIKEDAEIENKIAEPENKKEEEIEKNEEIFMVELRSEDSGKKLN